MELNSNSRAHRAARRAQRSFQESIQRQQDASQPEVQEGQSNGVAEDIDEDDLCPICQLLLHEPVTTTCRHTLCKFCMATWAATSHTAAPVTIVDVDTEPVPFDPVSDLEARCPMCRTLTSALLDTERNQALGSKYPQTWLSRHREAEAESSSSSEPSGEIETLTVHIGNRHTLVPPSAGGLEANQHEWEFFVKPSRTDIIKEVHIHLHPTFPQNHIVRTRPPYAHSRLGWGSFTITAKVVLKAGYSWVSEDAQDSPGGGVKGVLPLEWMLDFDGFGGKGSMGRFRLKVRDERRLGRRRQGRSARPE